jgi:diguanylate cyclase (GGDEF)-like protein
MGERFKIGIIYRGQVPQILDNSAQEGMFCRIEYFPESRLLHGPIRPVEDYLAIFFSIDHELQGIRHQISNMFPGAELVGYQNSAQNRKGGLDKTDDGLMLIQLPAPLPLMRFLLESFAAAKTCRKGLICAQRRLADTQEFFDAFMETIESSSDVPDLKPGMNLLINKILMHIPADECLIYLNSDSGPRLHQACSTGNIQDIELFDQSANRSIIENVLASGIPYVNNNYFFELKTPFSQKSVFIRSILCYPLLRRGKTIGAIELLNKVTGTFTPDDQDLIEMVINPLAVAIRTISHFEELERLTITDDLTKLYNYRYIKKYLEANVNRCLRYKKKVSLLFIDIDGFKQINDTFGHLIGSQALSEMGQVFKQMVRETDIVGRYGGDEFIIILPETPLNGAMVIAERIRKRVEEYEFVAQNLSIRLTVSLGVANCPRHTVTAEGLIKKADAAMYRAKELSKNSIKIAV